MIRLPAQQGRHGILHFSARFGTFGHAVNIRGQKIIERRPCIIQICERGGVDHVRKYRSQRNSKMLNRHKKMSNLTKFFLVYWEISTAIPSNPGMAASLIAMYSAGNSKRVMPPVKNTLTIPSTEKPLTLPDFFKSHRPKPIGKINAQTTLQAGPR